MKPISYIVGDAISPEGTGPKIIAHCCNDIGSWGAGFVLALSKRWREPEEEYRRWAFESDNALPLGRVQFVEVGGDITVANIIGQRSIVERGGRAPIRYGAIGEGLGWIGIRAQKLGASVHMPRIGCGLAGGNWDTIEPIITETLCIRDIPVFVYDLPKGGAL